MYLSGSIKALTMLQEPALEPVKVVEALPKTIVEDAISMGNWQCSDYDSPQIGREDG